MKLAIVILNWNGSKLLKEYLPKVVEYSKDASIFVIDNASTDDSLEVLTSSFPEIQVISNKENLGFAGGYNEGLKRIEADVFCLLNSDVEVTQNWTVSIINAFQANQEIAIAQPKILDLKNREYFEYAGAGGGFIDKLGYPFCRGRIFQCLEKDTGQYDDITEVFWATGACMFIKKEVFADLKGFDASYFAHQEEIDLCWRAKNRGYKVYYIGKSHIYHLGGSTLKNSNPNKTFLNFRNSLYSITKNLPRKNAFELIFKRLLLDGIAVIHFAAQFKFLHSFAILRAHLSFYRNFSRVFKKREKANFVLNYYFVKSIVWSHFVHQVKNFNILVKD
ncbi:glycosyltransferase family 2 protein [Croceitalea rosinachiae]|uniref:Glycosyltransferase family 2 protein n=1 Tax=Croceitalea rosinachiae TaxID=3075596 RepID=A0ABU3ADV8_9FLAO|nr:glycosyltransferase family 2 protein [Croceitalea sp. F388]MDT0607697.1 glycosyltransferase family 2 protein [Croceitalea sp. F388]